MCGIAGVLAFGGAPVDRRLVERMTATLVHRGPDEDGVHLPDPSVGLGHRRLSIIDLTTGRQPMSNEDGRIWITFNGEIFNYRELREELVAKGHVFRTTSDTEVLVHLYEEEGPACVERLDGQFAFAIWDGTQIFCARDPLGIKPLYYASHADRFLFASEPRAILAVPGLDPEPDVDGIDAFFRYRYIPAPLTGIAGVSKLLPGEWLSVDRSGRQTRRRYWDLDLERVESLTAFEPAKVRVREELARAVRGQMVSDVPIGAFLSGGLDSSSTAALMAQAREGPVQTFAIGFDEPDYDERVYARAVAERSGTEHYEEVLTPQSATGIIDELLAHVDEPYGDTSMIPTFAVCRLARRHVKVVISGDGGDELFAGYGRFFRALRHLGVPPWMRPLLPMMRRIGKAPTDPAAWTYPDSPHVDDAFRRAIQRGSEAKLRRLFGPRLRARMGRERTNPVEDLFARASRLPPLSRLLYIDLQTMLSEYHLVKVDRVSMQHSLEVRVPILDKRFVELAFRLSPQLKLHGGASKSILREAMRDLLPDEVLDRKKKGFRVPLKYWFAGDLAGFAAERLGDARVVEEGLIDRRALDQLLFPRGQKTEGSRLWRVLVLEAWLERLRRTPPPLD